jgi:hypothetical protein
MHQPKLRSRRRLTAVSSKVKSFQSSTPAPWPAHKLAGTFGLVAGAALLVAAVPVVETYRNQPVQALLALDVSDSSFADSQAIEAICREQTKALKPKDQLTDLVFADTTEPTANQPVTSPTHSFGRCKDYAAASSRPSSVGQGWGTSPSRLFDRAITQVRLQQQQEPPRPVALTVWLDAAEPGPGLPPLDFDALGEQMQQLQSLQTQVAIIGPTGQLREGLERLSLDHPNLRICGVSEAKSCIQATFAAARQR